jgi:hypothetical protein
MVHGCSSQPPPPVQQPVTAPEPHVIRWFCPRPASCSLASSLTGQRQKAFWPARKRDGVADATWVGTRSHPPAGGVEVRL